ncbi:hypothetical protein K439DRAFT_1101052 [Ramaria rubella]|nr:hypothetical protein K439DRAFT_1101052 [Ramaria rubella]
MQGSCALLLPCKSISCVFVNVMHILTFRDRSIYIIKFLRLCVPMKIGDYYESTCNAFMNQRGRSTWKKNKGQGRIETPPNRFLVITTTILTSRTNTTDTTTTTTTTAEEITQKYIYNNVAVKFDSER